ncbi:MAG: NAD(P)-dependent oxidoreductase [Halioglobus sp.]
MSAKINVGYIGLGNIGKPSAKRLIVDAYNAHVYDVFTPAVEDLVGAGALACATVAELAGKCMHIGVCVRDDTQVEDLLHGDDGIFANAKPGTLIAIHSTVTQANLLRWAQQASDLGFDLIDAPITGGAHRAAEGTLCYMVGGTDAQLESASPVFLTSAEKIVHAGPIGSGIALKLCNNFIQYAEFVAMVEATRLAEACGLSPDVLRAVGLSNGVVNEQMFMFASGRNAVAKTSTEADMDPYFGAMGRLAHKDLECAITTAAEKDVVLPTAEFIRDRIVNVFLAKDESRPPM